jgi:hypothetical protein
VLTDKRKLLQLLLFKLVNGDLILGGWADHWTVEVGLGQRYRRKWFKSGVERFMEEGELAAPSKLRL